MLGASCNPASSIPDISDLLSFTLISQAPVARAARWRPSHTGLTVGRSSLRRLRAAPWWARWTNGGDATSKVATPSMASSSRYLVSIGLDGFFIVCPLQCEKRTPHFETSPCRNILKLSSDIGPSDTPCAVVLDTIRLLVF